MEQIIKYIAITVGFFIAFSGGKENNWWKFSWGTLMVLVNFYHL